MNGARKIRLEWEIGLGFFLMKWTYCDGSMCHQCNKSSMLEALIPSFDLRNYGGKRKVKIEEWKVKM